VPCSRTGRAGKYERRAREEYEVSVAFMSQCYAGRYVSRVLDRLSLALYVLLSAADKCDIRIYLWLIDEWIWSWFSCVGCFCISLYSRVSCVIFWKSPFQILLSCEPAPNIIVWISKSLSSRISWVVPWNRWRRITVFLKLSASADSKMRFLRKTAGYTRWDHKRNEDILTLKSRMVNKSTSIFNHQSLRILYSWVLYDARFKRRLSPWTALTN
jgi:hypothetical protein